MTTATFSRTAPKTIGSSHIEIWLLPTILGAVMKKTEFTPKIWEQSAKIMTLSNVFGRCHYERSVFPSKLGEVLKKRRTAPKFCLTTPKSEPATAQCGVKTHHPTWKYFYVCVHVRGVCQCVKTKSTVLGKAWGGWGFWEGRRGRTWLICAWALVHLCDGLLKCRCFSCRCRSSKTSCGHFG